MAYVELVLRTDNGVPRVCTGRASGRKEYCWD
jgi:hypothetical protein